MSPFKAIKMVLTLHCNESSHLLSDAMDRRLTPVERLALGLHLMLCGNCRGFRGRLRFLAEMVRWFVSGKAPADPSAGAWLSPEARQRIEEALRQDR